uniref:Uncharacterized protein n=2 Tax=Corethron hystrix TaxID=216773 RepID=A0A7S1FLS4_9STRA
MSLKSEGDIKDADRNGIDLIWLVRDDYVGHAMLDAAAAAMLVGSGLLSEGNGEENTSKISFEDKNDRRHVGEAHSVTTDSNTILSFDGCPEGHSLGPNWKERLQRHMCTRKENVGRDIGQQHLPPFKRKRGGGGCSCCSISPGAFVLPDNGSNQIEKRKLSKKKFMSPSSDVHLDIRYSVSLAAALRQGDDSWIYLNSDAAAHLQSKAAVSDAKAFNPTEKYELCLLLSDGTILHADALISATGTNSQNNIDRLFKKNFIPQLARAPEGAVAVNKYMQCILNPPSVIDSNTNSCPSSSPFFSIYAAGDCADPTAAMLASFSSPSEPLQWHRMKLWTQAQSAGKYAARCMAGQRIAEELGGASGCGFETFVHVTNFVGKRVVLLGRYNGQGMEFIEKMPVMAGTVPFPEGGGLVSRGSMEWGKVVQGRKNRKVGNSKNNMSQYNADVSKRKEDMEPSKSYIADVHLKKKIEILARFTEGEEYIKVVVVEGKIIGAMIVGDSNLAETIENLMMSGTDISELGFDLLDPDVDVEDFFD